MVGIAGQLLVSMNMLKLFSRLCQGKRQGFACRGKCLFGLNLHHCFYIFRFAAVAHFVVSCDGLVMHSHSQWSYIGVICM